MNLSNLGRDVFVVWSYGTPIAWCVEGFWRRPAVKYSATTSKHQGLCPRAGQAA